MPEASSLIPEPARSRSRLLFWSATVAAVLLIGVSIIAAILAHPTLAAKAAWIKPEMDPAEIQMLVGMPPIETTRKSGGFTMTHWYDGASDLFVFAYDHPGSWQMDGISCGPRGTSLVWRLRRWLEKAFRRPACPTDAWDRWRTARDGWMEQWHDEKGNWLGERSCIFIAH